MEYDTKRCQIWFKGKCTSEEEREKRPLIEARLELRAMDDRLRKLRDPIEKTRSKI